jgi:hypothetical protein
MRKTARLPFWNDMNKDYSISSLMEIVVQSLQNLENCNALAAGVAA